MTHGALVSVLAQNVAVLEPGPDDVVLAIAPFVHIMGMVMTMFVPLSAGATVLAMPHYDGERFASSVAEHRVSILVAAPPMAPLFVIHPGLEPTKVPDLRVIAFGGAPLPADHQEAIAARYPGVVVGQGWGMTELGVGATSPRLDGPQRPGSVGRLLPNTELRVVDPAGGDRDIDGDGFVFVVDRIKDLIKVKGYQVAPAELEAILMGHPDVRDAAVVGSVSDGREVPVAFVAG